MALAWLATTELDLKKKKKLGHLVWSTKLAGPLGSGTGFLFCSRCGQYAQNRANGFRRGCWGKASGSYKQTKKLQEGRHPVRAQWFGKPTLLRVAVKAAAEDKVQEALKLRKPQKVQGDLRQHEHELLLGLDAPLAAHRILQEAEADWLRNIEGEDHSLEEQMAFFGDGEL